MSHAKLLLQWSVILYQMLFDWHSGRGLETSIAGTRVFVLVRVYLCWYRCICAGTGVFVIYGPHYEKT